MSPSPPRSLLVIADVGGEPFHVGDEAMLAANLNALRRQDPAIQCTVIGRSAEGIEERFGVAALAAPRGVTLADPLPDGIAKALAAADGLFLSGGGNLCSSWPDLLRQRILLLRAAHERRLPIVTGGQTIGPELTAIERSALGEALAAAAHVGVRELPSAALALQMGVPADRLTYQCDDAFFLAGRPPAGLEPPFDPGAPFVAVTLDKTFASPGSRGTLRRLAAELAFLARENELQLAFLPHVGPLGQLGDEDCQAGTALAQELRAEGGACTLLPVLSPEETVWLTQQAALVVASRYHPLVFATAAAVPCLGIYRDAYTRIKLQGALAHVGLEAWCLPAADGEAAAQALRQLWTRYDEIRAAIAGARERLELQESRRWRQIATRMGWPHNGAEAPAGQLLGAPADRLAASALAALALERQASDAETWRWREIVGHLERSVDLASPGTRVGRRKTVEGTNVLTEQQWNDYTRDGFLHLGKVVEAAELEALRQRADDLAAGHVRNPDVQMQLDTGGVYEELPAAVSGFERGTTLYRKIQGLETDELFARLVRHPLFLEICARQYGRHAAVSIFRAMVMNKPAGQGTYLPWHQDGGDVWALDRDPLVTVWIALDPATRANGCVEVVPGTHHLGLLTTFGSTIDAEDAARHCPPDRVLPLEVEAGHAVLLHNWLIHRSGVNPSPVPRRAFTVCYMDGRTQSTLTGNHFPVVAGSVPAEPYPYVRQLREENAQLRQMREEAERYAKSLEAELRRLRASRPVRWLSRVRARFAAARS